jgi:hypothetical protein
MIITSGAPIYTQLDGIREGEPVNTEVLLDWQQQLDCGDAKVKPLIELMDFAGSIGGYTHRLYSVTGGVFHVTVEEGTVAFPEVPLPASLAPLEAMTAAIREMQQTISRLYLANALLEERVKLAEGKPCR